MSHAWDADTYLRFANERTQPAVDLVARIDLATPARIVDLGCGPGNSTGLLKARWPEAAVTGIDNSADMIAAASRDYPGVEFVEDDLTRWSPQAPYDLVFFQCGIAVGRRARTAVAAPAGAVASGGALAVQMPRNHDFATHRLMRQAAAEGPWRDKLAGARDPSPVQPPEFYYDCLAPRGRRFLIWETNYIQIMDDVDAIIAWLHGTGLRPFLARLSEDEQPRFLDRYRTLLAEEFRPQADGKVLLPYPRLFFIAYP
jgi:trans-aconitate 2-methyltransferase